MADHALSKGANVSVLQRSDVEGGRLQAVVRWSDPLGTADVDVSALLLGRDGRVRSDDDFVFYNAPAGGDGSVRLLGKRADDDAGEDRVSVDLETLPSEVETIVIAASLDAGAGSGFGDVRELGLVLLDSAGQSTARFDIADAGAETAMVLGELYLRGEEWKFRAVGQGWDSGLAGLATDYGITVQDEAVEEVPLEPVAEELSAEAASSTDLVEVEPEADPVAAPARSPRQGVRTRKKRTTAATLPPLTLAVDPSWQPARLFSISGVGNAEEQEKRATSTLLSTMMAVRDFGRALVSRFGGPAGTIETYLEVPFKIGERTSIPDGVLRVARAGRVWTALLEVKTGASQLRQEQVDRYLDLARQQGYDAVITLSNDLAPVGGAHPVPVDGRKLRKVALHHISWSEVLHEAQMQFAHRGVDDRLQAWMLAELIRYLEHPRSGAAGFDDMGTAWVPVREAVAAGTLRAADRKICAVTTSWEKLVRHLGLRLTGQLGVTVTHVLPRRFAADPAARAQASAAQLADAGTLAATLRIPGAAGPLVVSADLRTGHVRTSIEVESPRDGGSARRVNWILRQLVAAPDTLTVEVLFARREQTSCELLKDVRENVAALLPDPAAEVRAFRLTMSAPMGTRRNGLRKAFIPSVNDAVDAFYARVVQGLRPSPPKLPTEVAEDAISAVQNPS
ncbi:TerD family protein [Pseudonocardia sp. 73-21]|uniref:TerD family protein n=1 Tax=Pseudonocardia sp. 73-21 TaxID=1895809 RepID=UPI00095BB425|nr:TerD family protein [Pseudonocardia sp. 73-21]OJY40017.1 MAG: hypothetical protein BGP03_22470 [Pseudonocardia sp. 73-21]